MTAPENQNPDIFDRISAALRLPQDKDAKHYLEAGYHGDGLEYQEGRALTIAEKQLHHDRICECQKLFERYTGRTYRAFKFSETDNQKPLGLGFIDTGCLETELERRGFLHKTSAHKIAELQGTLSWAIRNLKPKEFHVLMAFNLFDPEHKGGLEAVAAETEMSPRNVQKYHETAKKKVAEFERSRGIDNTPYFRRRGKVSLNDQSKEHMALIGGLEPSDPLTERLFTMSKGLFNARDFIAISYEIFRDPKLLRDRDMLCKKLGFTSKKKFSNEQFIKIINVLKDAAARTKDAEALLGHIDVLRAELIFKNNNVSQARRVSEAVDEGKINFEVEGIKDILTEAYNLAAVDGTYTSYAAIFAMTRLYDAPHKRTICDIQKFGYTTGSIRCAGVIKSKIAERLRGKGQDKLAEHPSLRRRKEIPGDRDLKARILLQSKSFRVLYDKLDEEQKNIADYASTVMNPREYYAYFRRKLCVARPEYQEIADELELDLTPERAQQNVFYCVQRAERDLEYYFSSTRPIAPQAHASGSEHPSPV